MTDAVRRLLDAAARRLGIAATKAVEKVVHPEYIDKVHSVSEGLARITGAERAGNRDVSESMARMAFPDGRNMRGADRTGHASSTSERLPAHPLDSYDIANHYGRPPTQRRCLVDDYRKWWEGERGRKMTREEWEVLAQGCVGVTKLHLGQTDRDAVPPMNLAFADPSAHRVIQDAEKVLAPGEVANGQVMLWRRRLSLAEYTVRVHGTDRRFTGKDGITRSTAEHIQYVEENLEKARAEARETWSNLDKGHIREMLVARRETKIEGEQRTFEKVQSYAQKFKDILAAKPANVDEFMRLVKSDPELTHLRDVDRHLPTDNPSEWKPVIYSKHLWSGQETIIDSRGAPAIEDGEVLGRSMQTPDATRFAPDPVTGQVDMSGDHFKPKPGYTNFDYGFYDEQTGSWWHANHSDPRVYGHKGSGLVRDPMKVYRSIPEKFFAGYPDFDSSVICIGFVRDMR